MLEEIDEFDFEHRIVTNEYDTDICDDVDDNHFSIKRIATLDFPETIKTKLTGFVNYVKTTQDMANLLLVGCPTKYISHISNAIANELLVDIKELVIIGEHLLDLGTARFKNSRVITRIRKDGGLCVEIFIIALCLHLGITLAASTRAWHDDTQNERENQHECRNQGGVLLCVFHKARLHAFHDFSPFRRICALRRKVWRREGAIPKMLIKN